jgi:hypothetical protein
MAMTVGLIILGLLGLGVIVSMIMCLRGYVNTQGYNPNAKHYCCNCKKLEWECNCPDC